jgi:type IV fimbrial biogenesis protein FimT
MQRTNFSKTQRGVTLIECCVATAVVATLASVGVPSFSEMRDRRALDGVSAELANDLQYVRSEAVARNQSVRLTVQQVAGGACYVIHTGGSADCQCATDGTASCMGSAQALKTVLLTSERRVDLASTSASMLWHPYRGTVSPTGTMRLTLPDGKAVHHVVNILGRARTCSPQGQVIGQKVC